MVKPPQDEIVSTISRTFLLIFSWSYHGALSYFTIEPMFDIQNMQHDHDQLRCALREFWCRKEEEFGFVRTASGLSAAAAIAVFSWQTVENSFWLVKIFWNWSLMASIFSLISSAQQRLPGEFPEDTSKDTDRDSSRGRPSDSSVEEIQALLDPVLSWPSQGDAESKPTERPLSFTMIWIWQTPMMLMSYAWLLFLLGCALHLLTPIFDCLAGDWSSLTIPVGQELFLLSPVFL
ncbi:hypothetical protein LQW54_013015 [Pestalotiopsis sp. IQ-011]